MRSTYDVASIPRLLTLTAEDIGAGGRDNDFGHGVVRADRAVAGIADAYAEVIPPNPSIRFGTLVYPFYFGEALARVTDGAKIGLVRGTSDVFTAPTATLTKRCTLTAVGDPVRIVR